MAEYTKGEWIASQIVYPITIWAEDKGRETEIAEIHRQPKDSEEVANAQLIASAPLGYELAEFVAKMSSTWVGEGLLEIGEGDYLKIKGIALELLAKAESKRGGNNGK